MDVAPRLCLWLRVQVEGPGNGSWSLRVSRHKGLSVGGRAAQHMCWRMGGPACRARDCPNTGGERGARLAWLGECSSGSRVMTWSPTGRPAYFKEERRGMVWLVL